jgi:hypothetical protein
MKLLDDKNNDSEPMSCLLFFDSLRAHQKMTVRRNVIKWLNAEWKRLGKSVVEQQPFSTKEFRVLAPRGKYDLLF